MSISSNLTKLTTDITNAYTSINNKGGTIPANKNTNNLSTAIDSIQSSNIIGATAEGESLSLTNTKAMPYSDYVVKGKSEQETGKSKNLFDYKQITPGTSRTIENGGFVINDTSFQNGNVIAKLKTLCPDLKVGDKFKFNWDTNATRNNSDVTYIYLSSYANTIRKDTLYTCTQTMLDSDVYFYGQQGEYYKNIMFYLDGQTSDYEPYGEKPSPSIPSEIHSVADDVNLFDASKIANSSIVVSDNGKTIIMPLFTSAGGYTSTNKKLSELCPELKVGDTVYLHFLKNIIGIYNNYIYLVGSNRAWQKDSYTTITQDDLNSTVILYGNDYSHGETEQLIITDFKIQKGSTATPYSPYNQGTVKIKQRGKNLWNEELEDAEYDNNGNKQDATIWLVNKNKINVNPNTTYTISQQQTPSQYRIICFNNNTFLEWISSVQDITTGYKNFTFTTPVNCNKVYIQFRSIIEKIAQGNYNMIPSDITNIQLEQGSTATSYEPYQGNNYTFQTEPLRSLPNGVKDTIEADGIHRRVGRVVLDGSESWISLPALNTADYYAYYFSNNLFATPNENVVGVISDYFIGDKRVNRTINKTNCWLNNSASQFFVHSPETTVSNFQTWLSNNPTEVLYELAEEVIEPLTQNQATTMLDIIKTGSYEGTTNIYTDEDVKPTIGVGYYKKG